MIRNLWRGRSGRNVSCGWKVFSNDGDSKIPPHYESQILNSFFGFYVIDFLSFALRTS